MPPQTYPPGAQGGTYSVHLTLHIIIGANAWNEFTLLVWLCMISLPFMLYNDSNSIRTSHSLGALSTNEAENHKNSSKQIVSCKEFPNNQQML